MGKRHIDPFEIQRRIKDQMRWQGYKFEYGLADPYKCRVIRPDGSIIIVNVASIENALLPQDKELAKPMGAFWKSLDEHILDNPPQTEQGTEEDDIV